MIPLTSFHDMSDFQLHSYVVIFANAASKAYAKDPSSDRCHVYTHLYEVAHMEWNRRKFITAANGI